MEDAEATALNMNEASPRNQELSIYENSSFERTMSEKSVELKRVSTRDPSDLVTKIDGYHLYRSKKVTKAAV
jgi:hypothetical protein